MARDAMGVLAGFAVIAAMVLFFATAAALVEWWVSTAKESTT
jgi:hypothetical protein